MSGWGGDVSARVGFCLVIGLPPVGLDYARLRPQRQILPANLLPGSQSMPLPSNAFLLFLGPTYMYSQLGTLMLLNIPNINLMICRRCILKH